MARLHRDLQRLELISRGSYAEVFRVHGYGLWGTGTEPLAYKQYLDLGASGAGDDAATVIEFRRDLARTNHRVCAELDEYFAWPREDVRDGGRTCGFLMYMADPEFFWESGNLAGQPRGMDWLMVEASRLQAVGLSEVSKPDRLVLMTQLAFALALLHNQGWVFGDLSSKNVLFRLDPPRILLLDCDGAAELGDPRQDGKHTPFWFPPEYADGQGQLGQTLRTDVYKLGLAILRCLAPGPGVASTYDVARLHTVLDAEGVDLVTRALSDDPNDRPRSAREIFEYLRKVTEKVLIPPKIEHAGLLTPIVLMSPHGQEGRVTWRIEGATRVSVLIGESSPHTHTVLHDDYPTGCAFPVPRPGKVTLVASNPYGTDQWVVGDVSLFEVPAFSLDLNQLPKPEFPALAAFGIQVPESQAGPGGGLPGVPGIAIPDPVIPAQPSPVVGLPSLARLSARPVFAAGRQALRLTRDATRLVLRSQRRRTSLRLPSILRIWSMGKSHGKVLFPVAARWREPGAARGRAARRYHGRARQVRRDGWRPADDGRGRGGIDVFRAAPCRGGGHRLVDRARFRLGRRHT